jgi:hypothetical protein
MPPGNVGGVPLCLVYEETTVVCTSGASSFVPRTCRAHWQHLFAYSCRWVGVYFMRYVGALSTKVWFMLVWLITYPPPYTLVPP